MAADMTIGEMKSRGFLPGWVVGLVAIVLATVGGVAAYRHYMTRYVVSVEDDGRAVAKVVATKFEGMGDLRVSRLSGIAQSVSADSGFGGILPSTHVMKAPFEASYFVDLSKLDRRDFFWDDRGRTLIVTVPDIRVDAVDVDEARTTLSDTGGLFVTRAAMARLRQQASAGAQAVARREATKPERIEAARRHGRSQIMALLSRPLRIAGVDATVQVHYQGEPGRDGEQMDRSRSIAEILAGSR